MIEEHAQYPARHHLRVLVTPGLSLLYFLWGSNDPFVGLSFILGSVTLDYFAEKSGEELGSPNEDFSALHFSLILYALFVLYWVNLYLALSWFTEVGVLKINSIFIFYMLFLSGGISGPVTGHELTHRRSSIEHWMGRLLYCGFLHDHWWVDHIGSHHRYFGMARDPSTARLDETLPQYFLRLFPSQARSAWSIELKKHKHKSLFAQFFHNTLIWGLLIEIGLLWAVYNVFGFMGLALFVSQSIILMLALHTVNFFQHWGLVRTDQNSQGTWDSNHRATLFSMLGLLRHADHHRNVSKPYHQLSYVPDSPKMPFGFGAMIILSIFKPKRFNTLMRAELERLNLLIETES